MKLDKVLNEYVIGNDMAVVRVQELSDKLLLWGYWSINDPSTLTELNRMAKKRTEQFDWFLEKLDRHLRMKLDVKVTSERFKDDDWFIEKMKGKKMLLWYRIGSISGKDWRSAETYTMLFVMDEKEFKYTTELVTI